ncbi:hypothetical protein RAD16_10425 [Bradyrhizobium sp. 18BD]
MLQRTLEELLATNRRELALLNAERQGAQRSPIGPQHLKSVDASGVRQRLLSDFDGSPHPYMLLDPGPGLQIVDINAAYAAATFTDRDVVARRSLFEIFPDNRTIHSLTFAANCGADWPCACDGGSTLRHP